MQALRSNESERGMLRLLPKTLALRAVQRRKAASTSASPWIRLQQGVTGGLPMVASTRPRSNFAQTPSLRVSFGHFFPSSGLGFEGRWQSPQAEMREKKRRLRARRKASETVALEAIV